MSDGDSSSCLLLVSLLICAVNPISRVCVVALAFVSHILVSSRNGDDPIACRITSFFSCLIDVVEMGIDGFCVYSLVNYNVSLCDIDVLLHKDMKIRPNKEGSGLELRKARKRFWKNFVVNSLKTIED